MREEGRRASVKSVGAMVWQKFGMGEAFRKLRSAAKAWRPVRSISARSAVLALATVAPVAGYCCPLALKPGVPAFQQDWVWPAFSAQCSSFMARGLSPWDAAGAGQPASYPQPWLPYLAMGGLCKAFGPHWSLVFFIGVIVALGSALTVALIRALLCEACVPALCIGPLVFWGNPVPFNEFQAGHMLFLVSYALLPGVALAVLARRFRWQWLLCGTALGLAAAQQQFMVLAPLLAFLISLQQRSVLRVFAPAVATMGVVVLPQWLPLLVYGPSNAVAAVFTVRHWEYSQSLPLSDALRLTGYIGGYDHERLPWAVRNLLWLFPIGAIAGICVGGRRVWPFAVAWCAGVLVVWGLYGPISWIIWYAFQHFRAALLFRELYDFAALPAASATVLYPCLVRTVVGRTLPRRLASGLIAVTVSLISLVLIARVAAGIPSFQPTEADIGAANYLAARAIPGRFITVPSILPIRSATSPTAGFSPWSIGVGSQVSALQGLALYPSAYGAALVARVQTSSVARNRTLRRLGISTVVVTGGLTTAFRAEPALQDLLPRGGRPPRMTSVVPVAGAGIVAVEPFSVVPGTLASRYRGARDLDALRGGRQFDLLTLSGYDPRTEWAATAYWPTLAPWVYAERSGIFTLRSRAVLVLPRSSYVVAGSASGQIALSGCRLEQRLDEHFELFSCGNPPQTIRGRPPLVVAEASTGAVMRGASETQGAVGAATIVSSSPWMMRVEVTARAASVLVVRTAYDRHWACVLCRGRHVVVDGFANGWVLSKPRHGLVQIRLRGARWYFIAVAAAAAVLLSCIACAATHWLRRSGRTPSPAL